MVEEKKEKVVEEVKEEKKDEIEEKAAETVVKEMTELLADIDKENLVEGAIQDNKIEFSHEGVSYRVRKAVYKEKQQANKFRMKLYVELLKDKDCLLEKDLRKLYKERGTDIDKIDKEILELTNQQENLLFDLGKAIKENKAKVELEQYKKQIIGVRESIKGLRLEKQQLLEISLENRLLTEVYSYLIWLTSEKKVEGGWVRIWDKYDDFISCEDFNLLSLVSTHGTFIISDDFNPHN
jgi:hypothetical protein